MAPRGQTPTDPTTVDETPAPSTSLSPLDRRRAQQRLRDYRALSFTEMTQQLDQQNGDGHVAVVDASEAGIGYRLVEHKDDKRHFVGVDLMVLPGWQVNPSRDYPGRYFTSCYVKTAYPIAALGGGTEFVVNDGSSGIAQQLADLRARCEEKGLDDPAVRCRKGFRLSEYDITDDVIDERTGQPVLDPVTRRPKQTPRLDPVTQQPLGRGQTFYLDTGN